MHTRLAHSFRLSLGRAIFQAALHRPFNTEARVWCRANICVNGDEGTDIGTGFCPRCFVVPCWRHTANATY
jgi:hypothetical protein